VRRCRHESRGRNRERGARDLCIHATSREARCEVVFSSVEAYSLEHDSFGTILFGIEEVRAIVLFDDNLSRFEVGHRVAGWPRFWKGSAESARRYLVDNKTRGFEISSSIGMDGWVLAGGFQIVSIKGVA